MSGEELSERVHRRPFLPVVIRMTDGTRYPILRSCAVAVMRKEAFVCFGEEEQTKFIKLEEIEAVEELDDGGRRKKLTPRL